MSNIVIMPPNLRNLGMVIGIKKSFNDRHVHVLFLFFCFFFKED